MRGLHKVTCLIRRTSYFSDSAIMGRRRFKKKTGPGANYSEVLRENKLFVQYYKDQGIVPEDQWDEFIEKLKDGLPATFRITGFRSHAQQLLKFLQGHYFSELLNQTIDGVPVEKPQRISWYPDELAWQFNLTRQDIRKVPALEKLHNFLVTETESGNISRQEAVSMIPPLLMDIKSHHKVLDMCAAPGSKTGQLIEMLHSDMTRGWPEGFVIANDADNRRCYIMVHQAKRLNSPCCMIVNHDASFFPKIKILDDGGNPRPVKYDRILCDVPCSGDGTLRKNYIIWKKWTVNSGINLHGLQRRILLRGVELLAVDGRLVYSTCSFNPLENEAVIASVLKECKGAVELVDASSELPGLKRQPGLSTWKVINERPETFPDFDSVPEGKRSRIRPSMFPPTLEEANQMNLTRCIRLLPHHQDTGGFFVAVLRKVKPLPWTKEAKVLANNEVEATIKEEVEATIKEEVEATSKEEVEATSKEAEAETDKETTENQDAATPLEPTEEEPSSSTAEDASHWGPPSKKMRYNKGFKEDPFVFFAKDEQLWPNICKFYDVNETFPHTQVLTRCKVGKKRNLYLVNNAVKQILQTNEEHLKVINSGVKVWSRSDAKGVDCDFRLTQDGIHCLFPYLSDRRVTISKEDVIVLLTQENPFYAKFTKETRDQIDSIAQGSLVFIYDPKKSDENSQDLEIIICGWKGKTSCRSFVAKGDRHHILRMCGVADTATYPDKPGGSTRGDFSPGAGASGAGASSVGAVVIDGAEAEMEDGSAEAEMEECPDEDGGGDKSSKAGKVECDSTDVNGANADKSGTVEASSEAMEETVSSTQGGASSKVDRTHDQQTVSETETSETLPK